MTLSENGTLVIYPLVKPESLGQSQPNSAPRFVKSKLSKAALCVDHKCTAGCYPGFSMLLPQTGLGLFYVTS